MNAHPDTDPVSPTHTSGLTRRRLLTAAGLGAGAFALPLGLAASAEASTDPYAALRTTWATYLSGGAIDSSNSAYAPALAGLSAETEAYLSTIQSGSGITALWADLPLGTVSGNLSTTLKRLKAMALAYATPGTSYTGSATLAAAIAAGLDFMVAGPYAATTTTYDSWWDWQIGCTQALEDAAILLYATLTTTQISSYCAVIDAFVPDPTKQLTVASTSTTVSVGSNRLDLCRAVIVRGALGESSTAITTGVAAISPTLPMVLYGDGLYPDYSYLFHKEIAYTGTYGEIFFYDVAALVLLLAGSTWAITDPNLSVVYDAVTAGLAPLVYNGLMLDSVRGRAVSRYSESDAQDGYTAAITLLLYAQAVAASDPTQAAAWQSTALGWLQRNTVTTVTATQQQVVNLTTGAEVAVGASYFGVYGISLAESVLNDTSLTAAAEPVSHDQFPNMARAVHRQPGWAYSLAMSSAYVSRYESINGENLHGWYTGDGMGYLYLAGDAAQFNDAFWDTVNPAMLPGTTADQGTVANSAGQSTLTSSAWAGGSVVAGRYGAVGMHLAAYSTNLTAVKSWFCLDSQVVALGAGITSTSGNDVLTTVENRNLHTIGNNTLYVDGAAQTISAGWSSTVSGVTSACLTGVAGYCFLGSGGADDVTFALTNQTGNWHDVNTSAPTTLADDTRPYLSIAIDHGADPSGAAYAYAILPDATPAQTATYAASPTVTVLSNTTTAQAISDPTLGVTMANFFAAGTAGPITVNAPASVSIQASGTSLSVTVSDPTRTATTVLVTVAVSGYVSVSAANPTVTVLSTAGGQIQLLVETGGSHGAGHSVALSSTGTAPASGTVTTLPATDTTFVRGGTYAAVNYGGETQMDVKNSTASYTRISLLKFDASAVTGTVERAVLWLRGYVDDSNGDQATLTAYGLSGSSWSESTVTYATAPSLGTAYGTGQITTTADWIGLDVTGLVSAAAGGSAAIGVYEPAAGLSVILYTREAAAGTTPFLEVVTT
ncbi:polysaccharide lyase 8 family protein [Actinospica durhamensis]|uniref:Polysaccharide lyase 8 family protein n=1 Tax=Actinospica durhamensis TaxID=1508375 RepID=A0A941EWY7_9ACTN|nr:polysaccharide lyase family 8 super-sandwich domain-containing protein [Actinospica durhamensis]MBR7838491.1 polysaccharide lyase 8 family protein [Actinospica durhamensis]